MSAKCIPRTLSCPERHGLSYHEGVHGLLRSVWDEPRPPGPPRRVWRDWALVGLLAPAACSKGSCGRISWRPLSVILALALLPTLLWRRTRPLLMVAIAFGVTARWPRC